jgi:hypothetical protein
MRSLDEQELEVVSGGDWEIGLHAGGVDVTVSGDESLQEILQGAASAISDVYWGARDATADFYAWYAAGWNYAASCGQGY